MRLSAYHREVKELLYLPIQAVITSSRDYGYSPTQSLVPETSVTVMQPSSDFDLDESLIRFGIRGVSRGLKKIVPRFVPFLGWAVTAKDIYDIATN
jgi:hypothetical protein